MKYLHSFFSLSLWNLVQGIYFAMIAFLNLDAKFSSEILGLNLDFIKFIVEKSSPVQVAPRILKKFSKSWIKYRFLSVNKIKWNKKNVVPQSHQPCFKRSTATCGSWLRERFVQVFILSVRKDWYTWRQWELCKGEGERMAYWVGDGRGGHPYWSDSWQPKESKWRASNDCWTHGHAGAFDEPLNFPLKMESQVFPYPVPDWPPRCWAAVNSQGVLLWSQCGSVNSWRHWGQRQTLYTFIWVIPLLQEGGHIWQQFRHPE